ncbi:MAG: hypothetical protein WC819_04810 [Parcubacteria group bacterium]
MDGQTVVTNVQDGIMRFRCVMCRHEADVAVKSGVRKLRVRCKCGFVIVCEIDRRTSRRGPYKFGTAQYVSKSGTKHIIQPFDISFGGMGFCFLQGAKRQLLVGQNIIIQYEVSRGCDTVDDFVVRRVWDDWIGVQYADGMNHPPRHRLIIPLQQHK